MALRTMRTTVYYAVRSYNVMSCQAACLFSVRILVCVTRLQTSALHSRTLSPLFDLTRVFHTAFHYLPKMSSFSGLYKMCTSAQGVFMHIWMYVCMYVRTYARMYDCTQSMSGLTSPHVLQVLGIVDIWDHEYLNI